MFVSVEIPKSSQSVFDEFEQEALELVATVRFRWEAGLLTDFMVSKFRLPVPSVEISILWNQYQWAERTKDTIPNRNDRMYGIYSALFDGGFRFNLLPDQGPLFQWPLMLGTT